MKTPKFRRIIASFFLTIFLPTLLPNSIYASNNGPKAPEAANFEPVDSTDMVNLATGDMNYVMPLLNVPSPEGGYPIALTYHGGIANDLESSWVGLGWNINPGSIERGVNGYPDDWKESLIRSRNYYNFESSAIDLGVAVGMGDNASIDVGVTYGWDSNGGQYGTVNLGAGAKISDDLGVGGGYSIGYGNKQGAIFNVGAGVQTGSGVGASIGGGTDGFGVGVNYSLTLDNKKIGKSDATISTTIGISLSSSGIGGSYSLSAGEGSSNFSINQGSMGDLTMTNWNIAIPLVVVPAWIKFGKRKIKYEKDETYANFVTGPLYFKDFNYNNIGSGSTYTSELGSEMNRDFFMDVYEQRLPESEMNLVVSKDMYEKQTYDFTFPSYDNYTVNAQGLAGSMTPRLFENGTLIGKAQNFEIDSSKPIVSGAILSGGILVDLSGNIMQALQNSLECLGDIYHFGVPVPFKKYTKESYIRNWNFNSVNRKFTNGFGSNNQNDPNQIRFYFENSFSSNLKVNPSTMSSSSDNNINSYIGNFNNKANNGLRIQNSNYVEVYTNAQMVNATFRSSNNILEAKDGDNIYNRISDKGYSPEGIGAYKITTPDGKTYHYSMPVYQFEEIYRQLKNNPDSSNPNDSFYNENDFYQEQRKIQPYATHWLLTAVTGPDYYDSNNNGVADDNDYGYWTRFDYGKWTDGYCWRTPYGSDSYNDFSNYQHHSSNESSREYAWGRKQLTYLNKVVTRTHTALFIKSVRKDSKSKEIGNDYMYTDNNQPVFGYKSFEGDNHLVHYQSQNSLKLDEIILINNKNGDLLCNNQIENITAEPNKLIEVNWNSPIIKNYNPQNLSQNKVSYYINKQQNILDKGDLEKDGNGNYLVYQKADKIIKFDQDYSLATNSPHSDAPAVNGVAGKGRLTLNAVKYLGKQGYDYLPATKFDYHLRNTPYFECSTSNPGNCNVENPWGYNDLHPETWSLKSITTPTGSKIEFELEKDTYWTEAFARRLFVESDLKFRIYTDGQGEKVVEFQKRSFSSENIDFRQYFSPTDEMWSQLFCCHEEDDSYNPFNYHVGDKDWFVMNGYYPLTIKSVTQNSLIVRVPPIDGNNAAEDTFDDVTGYDFKEVDAWNCGLGYECIDSNNNSHWWFNFKVLANKIPGEGTGGGLRVKAIKSSDELNNKYITEYSYNDPIKGRTSGVTSFAPVRGVKYIPYQTEVPAPRVMYEYVTVNERQTNTTNVQEYGKTVYQFNVLKNVLNIFDKNMKSGDYFRSNVTENGALNSFKKLKGANIKIEDNTSQLGSVISISRYNNKNQLISKSYTKRKSLDELKAGVENNSVTGSVTESFQSSKSIYKHNANYISAEAGLSGVLANYSTTQRCLYNSTIEPYNRFLNISTKTIYSPFVDYTEEINARGEKTKIWQEDQDPINGLFNTTYKTKADGKLIRNQIVPAYSKYPAMGSKVTNINNKNMLTQETMNLTSVNVDGVWKTTDASITTWNDTWAYRNESLGQDQTDYVKKVWRKHKTFAWKDELVNGAYLTNITKTNPFFDWGVGTPLSDKWQKLSEISRYTRWSIPIETKDINGNFASTKMGDKDSKVLVSGNARYTEMYYSGAEYVKSGNLFDGEVKGANFRSSDVAHTGKYSVKANAVGNNVFEVNGSSGNENYYSQTTPYNEMLRPGKYKVSFWALDQGSPTKCTDLMVNNVLQQPTEVIDAGCWKQFIYVVNIPANNTNNSIVLTTNKVNGYNYYDDFRMHPIASSVNSYVYDQETDELSFVLDAQNMGIAYKYDLAGRLLATYNEVVDADNGIQTMEGGFKISGQFKQTYKGIAVNLGQLPGTLNNCYNVVTSLSATIKNECISTFENKFKVNVTGGSGNYTYQYKWKKNIANNLFTNYINGTSSVNIPYVPKYCNANNYSKVWSFVAKVTDTQTGQFVEIPYEYESGLCNNLIIPVKDIAGIEISKCFQTCGNNDYSFRVHLKDIGLGDNYQYEYAYYNPNTPFNTQTLNWIDVTATNGRFCPNTFEYVPNMNCQNGYFMKTVYFTFRVKNLSTGVYSYYAPHIAMLECVDNCYLCKTVNISPEEVKYSKEGVVIVKSTDGKILSVYNVNDLK